MSRRARRGATTGRAGGHGRDPVLVAVALVPVPLVQAHWWTWPDSRSAPTVVADDGGPVQACCPLAAARGVAVGQSAAQARLRCPAARVVAPDHAGAAALWGELLAALDDISPVVEAADTARGLAYLDARGLEGIWGDAVMVARQAVDVLAARGLVARAGAGPTRLVARILADGMGADGPRAMDGEAARRLLAALPIDAPPLDVDMRLAMLLRELGVTTVGALARLPRSAVGLRFGAAGLAAWARSAEGHDPAHEPPLRPWTARATLTEAAALEEGTDDLLVLGALVDDLARRLATRLTGDGTAAALLTLRLDCADGARHVAALRPPMAVQSAAATVTTARDLLARLHPLAPAEGVTLVAGDLGTPPVGQPDLWGEDGDERERGRGQRRLTEVLAAHARRYDPAGLRRLRRDPDAPDGWAWDTWNAAEEGA